MKQIQLPLDTSPWAGREIRCPFSLIDAVFDFGQPEYYKDTLNEMVSYALNPFSDYPTWDLITHTFISVKSSMHPGRFTSEELKQIESPR